MAGHQLAEWAVNHTRDNIPWEELVAHEHVFDKQNHVPVSTGTQPFSAENLLVTGSQHAGL